MIRRVRSKERTSSAVPEVLAVNGQDPGELVVERALAVLRAGSLLIYPTDTLYAIGGRALDAMAAAAVRAAKGRDEGKPLPLIAAGTDQARAVAAFWPPSAERLAAAFWPGPLTLVLRSADAVPDEVTAGSGTVAVRVPALVLPRRLAEAAGPLVSTSANAAGLPPPVTCEEAVRELGGAVALALDGGPGRPVASTVVDLSAGGPRLLRAGAVEWEQVRRVLG